MLLAFAAFAHAVPAHQGARQLATRSWRALKSECDLAGGSFAPDADNCDTLFGSTSVTCGMSAGCTWTRRYRTCPREERAFVCQIGCSCSKNWWTGVCKCSGTYESGSHCTGSFTGPAAEGTCSINLIADGATCLTNDQCASDKCAAPVLNPFNRRCSNGNAGDICDPFNPCKPGLSCFLGGFCGDAGDSEGAPCDARVPCAPGWSCNGRFECTKMDGKLGSGCDAFNRCKEGTCSLGFKCLEEGRVVGAPCDMSVPCGPGLSCDASFACVRDDDWVLNSLAALPRDHRPECTLSQSDSVATNYMGNQRFTPDRVVAPRTAKDVAAFVKEATPGRPIKAVGGCASMSPGAATAGTLLTTYNLNQIQAFDEPNRLFWLGTGVSINDAVHYFAKRSPKLAMPNLGGWTGQTVVGAVTTGTHGSGVAFPPLCDFVRAVHLVAGDGAEYIFEPSTGARLHAKDYPGVTLVQDDEQFHASVVTVGSLGVVVSILYEALPYYWVAQNRYIKPWAELKGKLDAILSANDHVELWINPYDSSVLVSERNRKTADEFIQHTGGKVALDNKKGEFEAVRGFRASWELGMTGAAAAIQTARDADNAGGAAAAACAVSYLAGHDGKGPPAAFPAADSCVSQLLTAALEGELDYSGVIADYPFVYDTGRANSATVLCSEASVPLANADQLIDEYLSYANSLAANPSSSRNFYTAFASVRFSGASQHLMASSFGGARAYIEAPVVQGLGYQPNQKSADQLQLIDGWWWHIMRRNSQARLHFGLQNDEGWDAEIIQQRYPAQSWAMFNSMEAKYDPRDLTRSDYEDRIFGKGKYSPFTIEGGGCVRDGACVTSSNYPRDYGNNEACTIRGLEGKALVFEGFSVEAHSRCSYDALSVSGTKYCGSTKPTGLVPSGPIHWATDYSVTRGGWKLCPSASTRASGTYAGAGGVAAGAALLALAGLSVPAYRRVSRRKQSAVNSQSAAALAAAPPPADSAVGVEVAGLGVEVIGVEIPISPLGPGQVPGSLVSATV